MIRGQISVIFGICMEQDHQEGLVGMYSTCNLKYRALQDNWQMVLKYLFRVADSFSVITIAAKPFSEKVNCIHDEMLAPLESYLTTRIVGCRKWPGTETRDIHKVLCTYIANSKSRDIVLKWGNMFKAPELSLPEDICFYRNGEPFFVTISHEGIAYINNSAEDVGDFFSKYKSV